MAAAEGIRQTVRAKHGRWKSEATPTEYDGLAPGEEGRVSRALNNRLGRARRERKGGGCSTGCGSKRSSTGRDSAPTSNGRKRARY